MLSDRNRTIQLSLPTVTHLYLNGIPSFQIVHVCVALRDLTIALYEPHWIDIFLEILCASYLCFSETVTKLQFHGKYWPVRARHLETILSWVLPRIPNLIKLKFDGNLNIRTFKVIADRIRSKKEYTVSKSLKHLSFLYPHGYRDLLQINRDTKIRKDMFQFLHTFTSVGNMQFPRGIRIRTCWKYVLITNCMGRSILEDNCCQILPLSTWPILLEMSQKRVEKRFSYWGKQNINLKATGIYHVLRNLPVLFTHQKLCADNHYESLPPPKRQRQE